MTTSSFSTKSFGISDIGLVRKNNEDVITTLPEIQLYLLADGMGGHKAGEVAAHEASTFLRFAIEEMLLVQDETWTDEEMCNHLRMLYEDANAWVYSLAKERVDRKGMGTTLCSILFYNGALFFGNVGDSRIYRLRSATLEQLSFDHSLNNKLLLEGKSDLPRSDVKNVLTMAIGTAIDIQPQIEVAQPLPDDVYLLCSDGLSDYVEDHTIEKILGETVDLEEVSHRLIKQAKDAGSSDNISVVVVHCNEEKSLRR